MKNLTSENELAVAALKALAPKADGSASYRELIREIPKITTLTNEDLSPSVSRNCEYRWEQRVRNISSHKKETNNFIRKGYLQPIPSGLAITDAGKNFIQQRLN